PVLWIATGPWSRMQVSTTPSRVFLRRISMKWDRRAAGMLLCRLHEAARSQADPDFPDRAAGCARVRAADSPRPDGYRPRRASAATGQRARGLDDLRLPDGDVRHHAVHLLASAGVAVGPVRAAAGDPDLAVRVGAGLLRGGDVAEHSGAVCDAGDQWDIGGE